MFPIKSNWFVFLAALILAGTAAADPVAAPSVDSQDPPPVTSTTSPQSPLTQNQIISAVAGLDAMQSDSDDEQTSDALDALANSIPDADLKTQLDSLSTPGTLGAGGLRERLLLRWVQSDPASAASWAADVAAANPGDDAVKQVAAAWAGADFPAALKWLRGMPDTQDTEEALLAAAYEATPGNPQLALNFAGQLPGGDDRDQLIVHAAAEWASQSPSQAAGWAQTISDPDLRQQLIASIAPVVADTDPSTAAGMAAAELTPGETRDRAAVDIAQRWAKQSPRDAAAWICNFQDGASKDAAAEDVISIWTGQDSAGAANWWEQLPDGRLKADASMAFWRAIQHPNKLGQ